MDGTDFKIWEKKHPLFNLDRGYYSVKFNHAALKYEIAISTYESQVCWISGPHGGERHDMTIFRVGLKHRIAPGKKVNADRGYQSSRPDEPMLATPNDLDTPELRNYKTRGRLRQETFNGRLKKFDVLNQTFRHPVEKHKLAFEAVVVSQYHMDNGSPLYSVRENTIEHDYLTMIQFLRLLTVVNASQKNFRHDMNCLLCVQYRGCTVYMDRYCTGTVEEIVVPQFRIP